MSKLTKTLIQPHAVAILGVLTPAQRTKIPDAVAFLHTMCKDMRGSFWSDPAKAEAARAKLSAAPRATFKASMKAAVAKRVEAQPDRYEIVYRSSGEALYFATEAEAAKHLGCSPHSLRLKLAGAKAKGRPCNVNNPNRDAWDQIATASRASLKKV